MALSNKKKKDIKKAAQRLSEDMPTVELTESFQKDYEAIMMRLNEKLENRIDSFKSEAIPILREAYPTRPGGILSVLEEESEKIRKASQVLIDLMEDVKYPIFRECVASCLRDVVTICSKSIAEQYTAAFLRAGGQLQ
jgi:hypothetical protein